MIIKFEIEAEKVLNALIAAYEVPYEVYGDALRDAKKHVYFMASMDPAADFLGSDIAIEIETNE